MILSEPVKDQQGLLAVAGLDIMQNIAPVMDVTFLDHVFVTRSRLADPTCKNEKIFHHHPALA
jgi:hypothetical protein